MKLTCLTRALFLFVSKFCLRVSASVWFQVLADAVSRLVVDKFSELTDNFTSPHARRKVLAGVVMTTGTFAAVSCPKTAEMTERKIQAWLLQ